MSNKIAINTNLTNMAVTQFCGYDFNSFCKIGDSYFGANDSGIFELSGNDDAGTDIDAFFELIVSDFGVSNAKKIRSVFVGGEADGKLTLTLKDDEDNSRPYNLRLTSGSKQSNGKVDVGRDGLGRYWQVRIDNTSGVYFAIDSIELLAVIMGRKPR
jgi:hypothetical protein